MDSYRTTKGGPRSPCWAAGFWDSRRGVRKHITPFHLALEAFALIGFCLNDLGVIGRDMIRHPDWKLFLLRETNVERLFMESHQHGWLRFEAAGGIYRLEFPQNTFEEYTCRKQEWPGKELEEEKYDWAQQAMEYWPERVKEKCKTNKSFAIAHGLENLFEEKALTPKKGRRRIK